MTNQMTKSSMKTTPRNEEGGPEDRLLSLLDDACFLECLVGSVFLYRTKSCNGDVDEDGFSKLCDKDAALLEVCLTTNFPGWVELRCTGTVRVPPANLRAFAGDVAFTCHSGRSIPQHVFPSNMGIFFFIVPYTKGNHGL